MRQNWKQGAIRAPISRRTIDDVWLEVGFGGGEHLLWQALANPRIGLIGAEPYEAGVAKLLSKLADAPLGNIRIHEGDARDIIEALPDASLGRSSFCFPIPGPRRAITSAASFRRQCWTPWRAS